MNKKIIFIVCSVLLISLTGCWPSYELKYLTYYKKTQSVDKSRLRIDGVYYSNQPEYNGGQDALIAIVLFNNGFYLDLGVIPYSGDHKAAIRERVKSVIQDGAPHANLHDMWGVFKIENDDLLVQRFRGLQTQRNKLLAPFLGVFDYKFKIVNPTLLIKEEVAHHPISKKETFDFLELDEKPDSINFMITNKRVMNKLERLYHK